MRSRRIRYGLLGMAAIVLAGAGITLTRAHLAQQKAERFLEHGLWSDAREELSSYLWLYPRDGEGRLRMAEALVRDNRLPARQSVPRAIAHLQRIPEDSSYAARARTEQGRLELFFRHKPAMAERLFRRACGLDPDRVDPYYMLWKLFELTGRAHLASDFFWKTHERSPPEQRALRLREWYTSQFYPGSATRALDQQLGFLANPDESLSKVEARRFARFRQAEPQAAPGHAALASWFRFNGNPKAALETLEEGLAAADNALDNDFFVATLVGTLIDLGEFDRANQYFEKWPEPRQGYEYLLAKALVLDEIRDDFEAAVKCYHRAFDQWPGPVDWRTRYRYANCLARLGRHEKAKAAREAAKHIEQQMADEAQAPVRKALRQLDNAEALRDIVAFYETLGCQRERDAWEAVIDRLETNRSHPQPAAASMEQDLVETDNPTNEENPK